MAIRRFVSQNSGSSRERRRHAPRRLAAVLLASAGAIGTTVSFAAAGVGGTAAAVAPVISHAPRVVTGKPHGDYSTWAASNWSGYAEAASPYTGVSGTWTVPSVTTTPSSSYSSVWIGVDGFNNSNLIQTGTEEDWYNGAAHYNAWWEILPAAETALPSGHPVTPGDRMTASIYETSSTVTVQQRFHRSTTEHYWNITISEAGTTPWTYTTRQAYGGPGSSAEWIVEAPQINGRIASLAHYSFGHDCTAATSPGDFDNAGVQHGLVGAGSASYVPAPLNYQNDSGVMVQNNVTVSTPSSPYTSSTQSAYNACYGANPVTAPAG